MTGGYDKPLYILPFDHRQSYFSKVFGYREPLTPEQVRDVAASKQVIYEGFERALAEGVARPNAGILVDEQFGADILRDAARKGYIFAMSTEKSGQNEFDFEYGDDFARRLDQFNPTFAKVLVRYNPEGDREMNRRQAARLHQISDYTQTSKRLFMFELLVPAEPAQLERVGGDRRRYDDEVRPSLVIAAIRELQEAGVEPDVWKIEGLERREDCQRVVNAVQRDGRSRVGCIVLGRGEDEAKVMQWLRTAAPVPGFIGFAVGRSSFLDAIVELRGKKITREQAIGRIASNYSGWVRVFDEARRGAAASKSV